MTVYPILPGWAEAPTTAMDLGCNNLVIASLFTFILQDDFIFNATGKHVPFFTKQTWIISINRVSARHNLPKTS